MKEKIKVGLDFDGVIAYNPFRLVRAPIYYLKRHVLGIKKLNFWYPKASWQKLFWLILHESSIYPAKGIKLLERSVREDLVEAHIISGRYSFLDHHLSSWLENHKVKHLFKSVNLNRHDEQPHLFKEKMIKHYDLDFYIEDNLDIVTYLHGRHRTKIFWIYNLIDRFHPHPYKHPYLEKALEAILKDTKKQRHKNSKR